MNNLNNKFTYHYFLKPFYNDEYNQYFTKKLLESTHGKHLAGDNIDFVVSTNNVAVANVTVCLLLESVLTG